MERITKDQYYLDIATAVSKRSNCLKRHYGAIIVNRDEIIATGYNGSPRGEVNCCDLGICKRCNAERYQSYENCSSVHAEQNAMLSAARRDMIGATLYLSCENNIDGEWVIDNSEDVKPCPLCDRMIKNSGIKRIITHARIKPYNDV